MIWGFIDNQTLVLELLDNHLFTIPLFDLFYMAVVSASSVGLHGHLCLLCDIGLLYVILL